MTREYAIERLQHKIKCIEDGAICCDFGNDKEVFQIAIQALESKDTVIDNHYKKGFYNGLRTANFRYNKARTEIHKESEKRKNSLFGDGMRYCLEILGKFELEERTGL